MTDGCQGSNQLLAHQAHSEMERRTSNIEDAFHRSEDMDARRIDVEMLDGKVTLSGSVSSWKERNKAVTDPPPFSCTVD